MNRIARNDPCPCGSGKKFKKCHMGREDELVWEGTGEATLEEMGVRISNLPAVEYGRSKEMLGALDLQQLTGSSMGIKFSIRIPMYSSSPKAIRVEFRCPDPSCNPYLAFAAMLMAGLDGITNSIDPGDPLDKDIYDLDSANNVEVTPDEWYTAEIYENLGTQAQKYCYSFASR